MKEHAVVVAGGGPTGLTLAAELALAGVDVAIVEQRESQDLVGARAGGLHARTIEVFDQRGIADRFLSQGQLHRVGISFRQTRLDISDFPSRHSYFLALWQQQIERILAAWVDELGVPIYRGCGVAGLTRDDTGVSVALSDGASLRCLYLAGCDGGRSVVRKTAGIEFAGWDPTKSWLIAELQVTEEPAWGFREDATGTHAIAKLENDRAMRVVLTEPQLQIGGEPTMNDVSQALIAVYGTDFGAHSPMSISRFTDMTRQAVTYRNGRVLLAGDAAHVHPPMGGQGLNIGVQDAMNLGWKLAQVVKQISPESLLDTYHVERHPVAARVLRYTMAHVALQRLDERTKALGEVLAGLLKVDEVRKLVAAEISGLDLHYDLGAGHPLLGRRMPDLDLVTTYGPLRVFTLLHNARPALLNFGASGGFDITPWADRVPLIDAEYGGAWELPVIGAVAAPAAVLVRPDGYVAWAGDPAQPGLADALTTWFGPPAYHRTGPR
ncbi:MAG TPA: FAD-dependent monooxygenase [Terracidiphilus sp.]|jgi:3-(3-hydroxy-phenyl)propionate hydroxylase